MKIGSLIMAALVLGALAGPAWADPPKPLPPTIPTIHLGPAAGEGVVCGVTIFRWWQEGGGGSIIDPLRMWRLERCYRTRPARKLTQRPTDGLASLSLAWTAPRSSPIS